MLPPPPHTHTGNLLVQPDGRVAFIDFGIVGRISPVTWAAMEALLGALALGDYETMARALGTIGACRRACVRVTVTALTVCWPARVGSNVCCTALHCQSRACWHCCVQSWHVVHMHAIVALSQWPETGLGVSLCLKLSATFLPVFQ